MSKRTELQETLINEYIARDLSLVQRLFLDIGANFSGLAQQKCLETLHKDEDFHLLDLGCGVGSCIEELTRRLKLCYWENKDRIHGMGIDLNPLPSEIPQQILGLTHPSRFSRPLSPLPTNSPLASFMTGDVCQLPLADNYINFAYGIGTLIYIGDSLKALEEAYRVLKPGGVGLFDACAKELSITPPFLEILAQTPGAEKAFRYIPSRYYENTGFVIITKSADDNFRGFPFEVARILTRPEAFGEILGNHQDHYKNAVYKAAPVIAT